MVSEAPSVNLTEIALEGMLEPEPQPARSKLAASPTDASGQEMLFISFLTKPSSGLRIRSDFYVMVLRYGGHWTIGRGALFLSSSQNLFAAMVLCVPGVRDMARVFFSLLKPPPS